MKNLEIMRSKMHDLSFDDVDDDRVDVIGTLYDLM